MKSRMIWLKDTTTTTTISIAKNVGMHRYEHTDIDTAVVTHNRYLPISIYVG